LHRDKCRNQSNAEDIAEQRPTKTHRRESKPNDASGGSQIGCKHGAANCVIDDNRPRTADYSEPWKWPKAEDQARRQRDEHSHAAYSDDRRKRHIARSANNIRQRIEQPNQDCARKDYVGVGDRRGERSAVTAHRSVEPGSAGKQSKRKDEPERERDEQRMEYQRVRISAASTAQRPRNCRRNAAAYRSGRHHLHQHYNRKHQRDAGERIGSQSADEVNLDKADGRLRQHHQHIRCGEPQQRGCDRPLDQRARPQVITPLLRAGFAFRY